MQPAADPFPLTPFSRQRQCAGQQCYRDTLLRHQRQLSGSRAGGPCQVKIDRRWRTRLLLPFESIAPQQEAVGELLLHAHRRLVAVGRPGLKGGV